MHLPFSFLSLPFCVHRHFDHIYIGYGFKHSVSHYAPPIRVTLQTEYPVGEDVIEHIDKEVLPEEEMARDVEGEFCFPVNLNLKTTILSFISI